jgi:hypothetical protein
MLRCAVWQKMTDVITTETMVNFHQTELCNISEHSRFRTRSSENLKPHNQEDICPMDSVQRSSF